MNKTYIYPDYDDNGKKVLYYCEFIFLNDKVRCKIYKRQWLGDEVMLGGTWISNEVHPFVLFEYSLNPQTEPTEQTTKFMVDAMNEKYNREQYE